MTKPTEFAVVPSTTAVSAERRGDMLAEPGFGRYFTDHMCVAEWTSEQGWHAAQIKPYGPFSIDPANSILHYAQEIFEGLKAYRHADSTVWTFRPEVNAARFQRSAARMALPLLPEELFLQAIELLVQTDVEWVPDGSDERSLYLRPFMFASEVFLGVRPSKHVTFAVIASPAGPYFPGGVEPVSMWLSEDYSRAAPGGTGAAKCGGNYAASLAAQAEAIENGCDQVVFLDAVNKHEIEELGGMNIFFVHGDGTIVTPPLNGSILEGVTRASVLVLAEELGYRAEERSVSIEQWREGVASGDIEEVFACGTAAVVTPVGVLKWRGGQLSCGDDAGKVTTTIRERLLDIQYGRVEDSHRWLHRLV